MASIPDDGVATKDLLQDIESNLIRVALNQSEGNVSKAAKLLKIGRTTLIQKMSKKWEFGQTLASLYREMEGLLSSKLQ